MLLDNKVGKIYVGTDSFVRNVLFNPISKKVVFNLRKLARDEIYSKITVNLDNVLNNLQSEINEQRN